MSAVDKILPHLDKVRRTGAGTWSARCSAHDDRGPSLAVRELDDGRVLLHCFAGCDVHDVLAAVDLDISDLYPPRAIDHMVQPLRRPFPAADCLRAVGFDALVVAAAAVAVADGKPVTETDRDRLILAASRIHAAITAAGVRHG